LTIDGIQEKVYQRILIRHRKGKLWTTKYTKHTKNFSVFSVFRG
jgi:hypothetical protein